MQSCKLFGTSRLAGGFLFIQKREPFEAALFFVGKREGRMLVIVFL